MKKLLYATFALALVLVMGLTACQGGTPTDVVMETEPPATEEVVATEEPTEEVMEPVATLRIWADEQRAPVLNDLAADFLAEYNVELVVENISGIRDQFLVAAPAGEGPDIIVVAHDQAAAIVASGLAAPVDLGDKVGDFTPEALKAFTYEDNSTVCPMPQRTLASSITPISLRLFPQPGRKFMT